MKLVLIHSCKSRTINRGALYSYYVRQCNAHPPVNLRQAAAKEGSALPPVARAAAPTSASRSFRLNSSCLHRNEGAEGWMDVDCSLLRFCGREIGNGRSQLKPVI